MRSSDFISLSARVNGKEISGAQLNDPFELSKFPLAVDTAKPQALDKLGRDIVSVARIMARDDPFIDEYSISYTVEGGQLKLHSEQISNKGYDALSDRSLELGVPYRQMPQLYLLKATNAVLKNKTADQPLSEIAYDFVTQWKVSKGLSRPSTMMGMMKRTGSVYSPPSFKSPKGISAVGASFTRKWF